jgi:phosphoglycerate dehydrogenase-like enzyme
VRVVLAVNEPPIWRLPTADVRRVTDALPDDDVVDGRDPAALDAALGDADVLVTTVLTAAQFSRATRLRWLHTTAVGVGGVLSPTLAASDVVLTNARGVYSEVIAEHAVALALALRRSLPVVVTRQAERTWAQEELVDRRVPRLSGSHLLVVGLGAIGSRVAALGHGLGMRVTGVRRRLDQPVPAGVGEVLPRERLQEGLSTADVVVLAVPRTDATRHLIGAAEFAVMRPSAVLVNVARGRLIEEAALIAALESRQFAGAALDAFLREPLSPDSPLWDVPNLLISPHMAAFDGDLWTPAVDLFLNNLERFRAGETLVNVVDKSRGY